MLKKLSQTAIANDDVTDDSGWDLKCWSAIALFGLLLSIANTHQFLQQAGKSVALLAGGAAVATLMHKNEQWTEAEPLIDELYEIAIAEATLFTNAAQSGAASQAKIEQARARIAELEASLAEKTAMATEMLTELEAEATSTFDQFNAKIAAQDELINNLHRQIESLRATNAEFTARQTNELFASIGSDALQSQQRLSQLLKT